MHVKYQFTMKLKRIIFQNSEKKKPVLGTKNTHFNFRY